MHEGAWSSRLGIPGRPSVAETVIVARDIELCEVTGTPRALPPLLGRRHRRPRARGQGPWPPGDARSAAPHHFSLTDECCEGFDPMFKVHPPLRTRRRRRGHHRGPGRRHHRRHRHRPRAPHPGVEGAPVRGGAPGDARSRDRARVHPHRARRARAPLSPDALGLLSWRPAAIAGLEAHGGPDRCLVPEPTLTVFDPAPRMGGRPGAARQPRPEHARTPGEAHGQGAPHHLARRRGRAATARQPDDRRACSSWPTAVSIEGEAIGALRDDATRSARVNWCSTPRCRVTRRSSPTRRTRGRSSPSPIRTSATTASTPTTTRAAARSAPESSCGISHRTTATGAPPAASTTCWRATACPASRHRHPPAHASPTRRRRAPRRVRHRRGRGPRRRIEGARSTDGIDLVATVTTVRALRRRQRRRARSASSPTTSASSAPSCGTCCVPAVAVDVVPARTPAADVWPGSPMVCSSPTARAIPPPWPARPTGARAARQGAAVRHLPRAPDPRARARCRHLQAALRPPRRQPPGAPRSDRPGRDHQPEPRLRGRRRHARRPVELTHVNLNDGVVEGFRVLDAPAFSVQYHPEAGPGPHDARYLFDDFTNLMMGSK